MRTLAAIVVALALAAPAAGGVVEGQHLYGEYCLSCHGTGLAPSLRGVGAQAADFYLRTGYMPLPHVGVQPRRTQPLLDDRQIRSLVAYVASLAPGPPVPHPHPERGSLSQGESSFTEHCAGCHQAVAQGGLVTGAIPPPLQAATATQIAEAVRIGPYVMPRFSRRAIPDAELNSIVRYVLWTRSPSDPGGWSLGDIGPVPEGLVTWFIAALALVGLCVAIGERMRRQ